MATLVARTEVSLNTGRQLNTQLNTQIAKLIPFIFRLFLYVGMFLLLSSLGTCLAFIIMGSLEQKWDFHLCSWYISAIATCWPLLSSAQLTLHAKLYRDEFRDLRTLLDY